MLHVIVCCQDGYFFPSVIIFLKQEKKKKTPHVLLAHLYIIRIFFKIMGNCTDLYGIYCHNPSATNLL